MCRLRHTLYLGHSPKLTDFKIKLRPLCPPPFKRAENPTKGQLQFLPSNEQTKNKITKPETLTFDAATTNLDKLRRPQWENTIWNNRSFWIYNKLVSGGQLEIWLVILEIYLV